MRVYPEQLERDLGRGLRPAYLLCGDEPFLIREAADAIRTRARQGRYARTVMDSTRGIDWDGFRAEVASPSLFADHRLLELRLGDGRLEAAGAHALEAFVADPPPDATLLVIAGHLDRQAWRSRWVAGLDRCGAVVHTRAVRRDRLPDWIRQRLAAAGLEADREAADLLADRVEGNLAAAAQEVEKLKLLCPEGRLDVARVTAAVAPSARFGVDDLAEAALSGDPARAVRVLDGLRAEGIEPPLVLWVLADHFRRLSLLAADRRPRESLDGLLERSGVWQSRRWRMRRALDRGDAHRWRALIKHCAAVDRVVKGLDEGEAWDELLQLTLRTAGTGALEGPG